MERYPQSSRKFQKEMNLFKEPYYKINFIFLSLVGQGPDQNQRIRYLKIVFILCGSASFFQVQITKLFTSEYNVDQVVEILPFLFAHMAIATKYCTCWFHNDIIKRILERIKYDWIALKSKTEHGILRKYAELGMIYGIFYIITIYAAIFVILVTPFASRFFDIVKPLNTSREVYQSLKIDYLFNKEKYFYVIIMHVIVCTLIVATVLVACDVLYLTILTHVCGKINVLGYRLEHLFDDVDTESNNIYIDRMIHTRISESVKYHCSIYAYVRSIIYCYSFSMLIQLVLAMLIMTSVLLHMVQNLVRHNYEEVFVNCAHFVFHAFAVFMNILPTQMLVDHSSEIYHKGYCSRWYYAPVKSQKLLLIIMQRSRMPMYLNATRIITLSLETYATMIQTSISFFTALYSIK